MKNLIVFLLVLGNVGVATASYTLELMGISSPYTCTVNNTDAWAHLDRITWIFPDGQYIKQEMIWNQVNNSWEGNTIQWIPTTNSHPNPDGIVAYVAKKGGTTNPTRLTNTGSWTATANPPVALYFPPGISWQVNRTWEFSPGYDNYLFISYKELPLGCPLPALYSFEVILPPEIIMLNPVTDPIKFNGEEVDQIGTNKILVNDLPTLSPNNRHVFLKLRTLPGTPIDKYIEIKVKSNFCSTVTDSVVLGYVTSAVPHDPNRKTVNIKKICVGTAPPQLTYTIQFHNDGFAPVKYVDVKDKLPMELDPTTFMLIDPPMLNGIIDHTPPPPNDPNATKLIKFSGPGLPGFNQTNPSYSYDQTIYRFSFVVTPYNSPMSTIQNKADVIFINNGTPLDPVTTTIAKTSVDGSPPDCFPFGTEAPGLLKNIAVKPNPFQEQVYISFELLEKSRVNVEVRDIWGRLIATLASGECAAGSQNLRWDEAGIPEGVYLIFFRTENGVIAKRMVKS